jgi:hypothetical protein
MALVSMGVLPLAIPTPPRRELLPAGPWPAPLGLDGLAAIGAQMRAIAPAPKREKYELRPLAERKERRRKRKQRRQR